ncbi:hypothetical protein DFH29DRAFT_985347 [Suillus ampliporus]|nr:hypothetical protein DFH29DRAFT_985347 [Suillus ampliporus]
MKETDLYCQVMQGIDVQAAATAFWANNPPSSIRESVAQSLQVSRTCLPRPPRASSSINPSEYRPHVLASDRLLVCNYGAEALLAQFVAAFAGITASKTLNNWMAGLQFWHIVNGAPWHASAMVHHTRCGFSKMVPPSSRCAKCPPVTIKVLSILFDNLSFSDLFDCAVGAVTFTAFWCCCHLGELVIPSPNLFDRLKHVSQSTLPLIVFDLPNDSRASALHILWTKTTKEEGATISITARPHCTCPNTLINANVPATAPLFAYRTPTGWSPLTCQDFISRCNSVWTSQGFPPMPGHAFRIGGATELLLQGVHPDIVSSQGRWTSRSFLEYWRRIETILPLFISSSFNNDHVANVDTIMDSYTQQHRPSRSAPSV